MVEERRRAHRVPVRIWAVNNAQNELSIWFPGEPPDDNFKFAYSTKDLSYTGVFLESTLPLAVGTMLELELELPSNERVRVKGKVVRVVDPESAGEDELPGMGVEFLPENDYERQVIKKFVELYRDGKISS